MEGGWSSSSGLAKSWVTSRGNFCDFGFDRVLIGMEDGWGTSSPIRGSIRTLAGLGVKKEHQEYKDAREALGE